MKRIIFPSSRFREVKNYPLFDATIRLLKEKYGFKIETVEYNNISRQEVRDFYLQSDLVMLTSFSEGSPGVVKEAMACNLPVVSTNVGDVEVNLKGVKGCAVSPKMEAETMVMLCAKSLNGKIDGMDGREKIINLGFDAVNSRGINRGQVLADSVFTFYWRRFWQKLFGVGVMKMHYAKIIKNFLVENDKWENVYPTIIPNFDRSPRSGKESNFIWYGSTPDLFKKHVLKALSLIKDKQDEHKILFLMSWNEWGEGNYMEPDLQWGHGYLDALRDVIIGNVSNNQ